MTDNESAATSPSPLMDGGQEVGGLTYTPRHYPYVIRFTPADDEGDTLFGLQEILEEFLDPNFDIYVITEELKPYTHYHIYVETTLKHNEIKKIEKEFVYSYFVNRKRGFGTKQHSCLISDNPLNAITYALKQRGQCRWSGFTEEFIDNCRKASFEKKENDCALEMKTLEEEFLSTLMDPYTYAERISIIYSNYDRLVNYKNIQDYINSKIIKRDPTLAASMAKKNLSF